MKWKDTSSSWLASLRCCGAAVDYPHPHHRHYTTHIVIMNNKQTIWIISDFLNSIFNHHRIDSASTVADADTIELDEGSGWL